MAAQTQIILPNARTQFLDSNGDPLAAGSVYFYVPLTTTFKNTYQDPAAATLNVNPVTLDAAGSALIWGAGQYRQVVKDALGNTIWDNDTSGLLQVTSSWSLITADPNPAVAGNSYLVSTAAGVLNFTLPANPTVGDEIGLADALGTFGTNALTVVRNTKNIMGVAANLVLNINNTYIRLAYEGVAGGWRLVR
jgi:hypothetical protein